MRSYSNIGCRAEGPARGIWRMAPPPSWGHTPRGIRPHRPPRKFHRRDSRGIRPSGGRLRLFRRATPGRHFRPPPSAGVRHRPRLPRNRIWRSSSLLRSRNPRRRPRQRRRSMLLAPLLVVAIVVCAMSPRHRRCSNRVLNWRGPMRLRMRSIIAMLLLLLLPTIPPTITAAAAAAVRCYPVCWILRIFLRIVCREGMGRIPSARWTKTMMMTMRRLIPDFFCRRRLGRRLRRV
mmetsp:Transcript_39992/g.70352  ORF Transcript_39992/g.70352 Transcript_39992/m.70352 type:complete len:234 (-) Transcript_39992:414-1115(-)